jgi:hypothetical protein
MVAQRAAALPKAAASEGTDTVYRIQIDTVIVSPPSLPSLRSGDQTQVVHGSPARVSGAVYFSGCYDVLEGGAPESLFLETSRAPGAAGGDQYVVRAPGYDAGYWRLEGNSGVQIVVGGAVVDARFEPGSSSRLRGTVRRDGESAAFLAKRCR